MNFAKKREVVQYKEVEKEEKPGAAGAAASAADESGTSSRETSVNEGSAAEREGKQEGGSVGGVGEGKPCLASSHVAGYLMKFGDLVIIYESQYNIGFTYLTEGGHYQCRFGRFAHQDFVGKPFGSKIQSGRRYLHALFPTPEYWSRTLPSRTQICQDWDQSVINFRLNLLPGDVVVESGTGSGAMTTAIARAVAPIGHVHSFEFNQQRAEAAQAEMAKNQLGELVTITHRDVCALEEQGGGFGPGLDGKVDAVFLDLPEPWRAIPHVVKVLKADKKVCCYSPCLEQVQRTCESLRQHGFHSVSTVEMRLRTWGVVKKDQALLLPDMSPRVLEENAQKAALNKVKLVQRKKAKLEAYEQDKKRKGVQHKQGKMAEDEGAEGGGGGRGGVEGDDKVEDASASEAGAVQEEAAVMEVDGEGGEKEEQESERKAGGDSSSSSCAKKGPPATESEPPSAQEQAPPAAAKATKKAKREESNSSAESGLAPVSDDDEYFARADPVMRGHTAFLTFAVMSVAEQGETQAVGAVAPPPAEGETTPAPPRVFVT